MRRAIRFFGWLAFVLIALIAVAWWAARPSAPDAFYTLSQSPPSAAGELLRHEPFDRNVPPGARAWRILYTTTRIEGVPAIASAIVMVSEKASTEPRPIVAWTHGTTGITPGCGPSVLSDPFLYVPALESLLEQGWIYVATDYVGLGTAGPHPYLVGDGEARSTLDAVRAVRKIEELEVSDRTVVWGHSQGGHAAIWTGILAPTYAPDVTIDGVAAIAPATDLRGLIERIQHTPVGRIMSSYVLQAYSKAFPDVSFDAYASGWSKVMALDMAGRCLEGFKILFSLGEAFAARGTIFDSPPTSGSLGERLAQNSPNMPVTQPLLIAQGDDDDLVLPDVQARFVQQRCAAGQSLEFMRYVGRDHISIVAPDSALTGDLVEWTQQRLARTATPGGCREERR